MEPKRTGPSQPPLVALVGETASGKSALGLALARHFGGEVIAADSWTVYRGFDIGTAKPRPADCRTVPHHLLDVADPVQGFSAPRFKRLAGAAIAETARRGKLAFLVGGTGLYIDSLLYDFQFLPAPEESERERYLAMELSHLQQLVISKSYDTSRIDMRNKRRLIRLLENQGRQPTRSPLRPNTLLLGIRTERDTLRERVTARVDSMLAAGLEEEVAGLMGRYDWIAEPMKGIGYREWQAYFAGGQDLAQTRQRIISATMGLAKRQRTWFKRNTDITWLSNTNMMAESVDLITTFLHK